MTSTYGLSNNNPVKHRQNATGFILLAALALGATALGRELIVEASGVCRLGDSLVVAGDENSDSLWVLENGASTAKEIEVKGARWDDLEDLSAVDDQRFFALTSHSRTKKGKLKPEREQLLLVRKKKSHFQVEASWSLRAPILAVLNGVVDPQLADLKLNIEGLAYHGGELYLGLRAPLTETGEAIVLKVQNGEKLLEGETPKLGAGMRLTLGGKGIRGLASDGPNLIVIAGSSTDATESFSLFRWATASKQVESFSLPGFTNLIRPEGVVVEREGSFTFVQDLEGPSDQKVIVSLPE